MEKGHSYNWLVQLIFVLTMALFILLPSINMSELMQGVASGKMFFFLFLILIIGILLLLKIVINLPVSIRFSIIDGLLLIWIMYIFLSCLWKQIPLSDRLLELGGLAILYVVLRQLKPSQYALLLLAMVVGGVIQAFYGNLQLWGCYPSHHELFRMTGSFFNPGPYAGYLASVFPAALGLYIFKISFSDIEKKLNHSINSIRRFIPNKKTTVKLKSTGFISLIISISLIVILMVLPASNSRAAWLAVSVSSIVLLMVRFSFVAWLKKNTILKRCLLLLLVVAVTGGVFFGLFQLRTNSANGRLLVWEVTLKMVSNHPLTGMGFDRFKASYMNEQANYFRKTPESPKAMLAGDSNYCFNDFLQHIAENGIIGLILILIILAFALRVTNVSYQSLAWISKAGIISIAVFAFFSYPMQILPIKTNLICYLAGLSVFSERKVWQIKTGEQMLIKCTIIGFMLISFIWGNKFLITYREAWKNWGHAYRIYAMNGFAESLNYYEKAWHLLKNNGDYLTNYGKTLSMAGSYEQSVCVLHRAAVYYPNTIVYITLGNNYKELGKNIEAEYSYMNAWYMSPGKFYPKYLLAKLYVETEQIEKAIPVAQELLDKEIKIQSTAIHEIKDEMKKIIETYNDFKEY